MKISKNVPKTRLEPNMRSLYNAETRIAHEHRETDLQSKTCMDSQNLVINVCLSGKAYKSMSTLADSQATMGMLLKNRNKLAFIKVHIASKPTNCCSIVISPTPALTSTLGRRQGSLQKWQSQHHEAPVLPSEMCMAMH